MGKKKFDFRPKTDKLASLHVSALAPPCFKG